MEYEIIEKQVGEMLDRYMKLRVFMVKEDNKTDIADYSQKIYKDFVDLFNRLVAVSGRKLLTKTEENQYGINKSGLGVTERWRTNLENIGSQYWGGETPFDKILKVIKNEDLVLSLRSNIKKEMVKDFNDIVEYFKDAELPDKADYTMLKNILDIDKSKDFHISYHDDIGELDDFRVGTSNYNRDSVDDVELLRVHERKSHKFGSDEECPLSLGKIKILQRVLDNEEKIKEISEERQKQMKQYKEKLDKFKDFFMPKLNIFTAVDSL